MSVLFLFISVAAGVAAICLLWFHDPMLAILCIPMAASVLTTVALMVSIPIRRGRGRTG